MLKPVNVEEVKTLFLTYAARLIREEFQAQPYVKNG